jgi:hypothetical protein
MATQAQIVANQANAKKSTGPKSAEGKARVAQNAVKHGLTSTHVVRADTKEDRKDLKDLDEGLRTELNPQGALENLAFLDLLHAAWNLHRSRHMEAELGRGEPKDFYGPAFTWLDRIARYQTRCQRAYYRALAELRTLQTNRALRATAQPQQNMEAIPVLADMTKLTKQTQPATHVRPPQSPNPSPQPPIEAPFSMPAAQ